MKRVIICLLVAIMELATIHAQQIAVVSNGDTKLYQTLAEAIGGAKSGSVIYLPGGGFQISDDVKITRKVSIIGIGHKPVSENADGNTVISGNLYFDDGSDGSAVMGCFISGDITIGSNENSVNNILIKLCNLNGINISSSKCTGTEVNQNYIRGGCNFNGASGLFSNNVAGGRLIALNGGKILNNIFTYVSPRAPGYAGYNPLFPLSASTIVNNVIFEPYPGEGCSAGVVANNLCRYDWGDGCIYVGNDISNIFVNNAGISPASDFHFKGDYEQYDSQIGIYGGTGFDKDALPPVPYIVNKNIASQTDASGKLNIQIRVKAGR